jgi:hypothetical protein
MRNVRSLAILPFLAPFVLAYACGGDKPPPNNPDTTSTTASAAASSAAADTSGASSGAASAAVEPPKPVDTYVIPVAGAKFTPDKKATGWKPTEIKDDGSVMRMNKAYMKFVKGELQDDQGKAFFKVTKDGSVAMGDKPYGKFDDKDALVVTDGGTISVGDDGAVKLLEHDGKTPSKMVTGKFDNGKSKRAQVLLIATELWLTTTQVGGEKKDAPPPKK